jgi:hypothetical protein
MLNYQRVNGNGTPGTVVNFHMEDMEAAYFT